jgi:hypothetical protein
MGERIAKMTASEMLTQAVKGAAAELRNEKLTPEQRAKRQARRQCRAKARRELVGDVMAYIRAKAD